MRGIFAFTPRHLADVAPAKGNISFRQLREVSIETPGEHRPHSFNAVLLWFRFAVFPIC